MSDALPSREVSQVILGLQDRFECQRCGLCCRVGGNPPLFMPDIIQMSDYLGCDPIDGCRMPITPKKEGYGTHEFTLTRPCYFFDKAGVDCMIHDAKPQACKDYPFVLWAKGGCNIVDVLVCPEAMRLIMEHFGIGQPSRCDKDMEKEFQEGYSQHIEEQGP